jgi:hypothetical protein
MITTEWDFAYDFIFSGKNDADNFYEDNLSEIKRDQ